MGQVLQFRLAARPEAAEPEGLDLMSAVDFAMRDLADIARSLTIESVREQAEECRLMLAAAYEAELARA